MDGHDYDVVPKGIVIANIKALTDHKALTLAHKIYGETYTVVRL